MDLLHLENQNIQFMCESRKFFAEAKFVWSVFGGCECMVAHTVSSSPCTEPLPSGSSNRQSTSQ